MAFNKQPLYLNNLSSPFVNGLLFWLAVTQSLEDFIYVRIASSDRGGKRIWTGVPN